MLLFFITFSFIVEYTTFADIKLSSQGYRRLHLDGSNFGAIDQKSNGDAVWRCTKNYRLKQGNKRLKCNARLHTKLINGYEMIYSTKCQHKHSDD